MNAGLPFGALLCLLSPAAVRAQPAQGAPAGAVVAQATPGETVHLLVWARVETTRDRYDYRFENPSRFDTSVSVPHFFTERYRADNQWVVGGARYRLWHLVAETVAGVTRQGATTGEDYDTFFNPGGNTIVYGTTADVSLRSFRFAQHLESAPMRGWVGRVGYAYRRDRAVFHDSASTTTQTNPPSFSSFWNTDRETTVSETHEVQIGLGRQLRWAGGWGARLSADLAPLRIAKLTTVLPDKYPGEDIVFVSRGLSLSPEVRIGWAGRGWTVEALLASAWTMNYRASDQFHHAMLAAGVQIGFAPGR